MKKYFIYIICGLFAVIAAINFAAAYINNSKSVETNAAVVAFESNISSAVRSGYITDEKTNAVLNKELQTNVSLSERQINRYNLARFYKELRLGTSANSYTLSQHLDALGIPYANVNIVTPENSYYDHMQILAMSAVYADYNADNIMHFENYACYLWAYTHFITVNGNSYPATVLTRNTAEGINLSSDFDNDIALEYETNGSVTLSITPTKESYYELDRPENFTWSEEKTAEATMLSSMPYNELVNYILNENDKSVLYSPLPLYNQGSGTWCNLQFGGGTIKTDGCCPSAISMVLSYFKNERITPDIIASMYDSDAFRSISSGSFGISMCRQAASDYGLNVKAGNGNLSAEQIEEYLKQDCKIVMSIKGYDRATGTGGDFSAGFHYITLAGITSDGYVIVNNPGYVSDITYETAAKVAANQSGKCYAVFSEK